MLEPSYINGLTLLGGEPFEPGNQRALLPFLRASRESYLEKASGPFRVLPWRNCNPGGHPNCEATAPMLELIDVLVDGAVCGSEKDISCGSAAPPTSGSST